MYGKGISRVPLLLVLILFGNHPAENAYGYGELHWAGSWPYGSAEAVSLDRDRDILFLGSGGAALVLDVTDPANPTLITDTIRSMGFVTGLDYDPSTRRLYLATGERGLEIWDLATPSAPVFMSRLEVLYFGAEAPVERVFVRNGFAYLSCSWGMSSGSMFPIRTIPCKRAATATRAT